MLKLVPLLPFLEMRVILCKDPCIFLAAEVAANKIVQSSLLPGDLHLNVALAHLHNAQIVCYWLLLFFASRDVDVRDLVDLIHWRQGVER